jgi:DNA repair protein RadC
MAKIMTKYRLELVKEESHKYEVETRISCPKDVYEVLTKVCRIQCNTEEVFILITLNTKNIVTGYFEVHRGTINTSLVHPREVFKRALLNNASNIMVAHNHPSGDPNPSKEDIQITERLKEAGNLLGINLLDHIIVGEDKYISLKEKGVL